MNKTNNGFLERIFRYIFIALIILTTNKETVAKIIIALSERQPNGRDEKAAQPYADAKIIAEKLKPFMD